MGAGYILLGSGDTAYERLFEKLASRHKNRMRFCCAYDNQLAHKIEAGCDMFLMPSRYEPCGLNQIYSLKYGTVPIVRATGGLDDTIIDYTAHGPETGNGFKFEEYTAEALFGAVRLAITLYKDGSSWRRLMLRGMSCNF
jgi:starch synthase